MVVYIIIGILWGIFCSVMQTRVYPNNCGILMISIVFISNMLLWPISIIIALIKKH